MSDKTKMAVTDSTFTIELIEDNTGELTRQSLDEGFHAVEVALGPEGVRALVEERNTAQARVKELEAENAKLRAHLEGEYGEEEIEDMLTRDVEDCRRAGKTMADIVENHMAFADAKVAQLGNFSNEAIQRAEKAEAQLATETKRWLTAVDEGIQLKAELAGTQIERYQHQIQELEMALLAANAKTETERVEELARKFKLSDIARREAEAQAATLLGVLEDLADMEGKCSFDHHGFCQEHSWFRTEPKCPHARAQAALAPESEKEKKNHV